MIAKIIETSVRNPWLVIVAWLGIAVWGVYALLHTPIDAIPDLSENQVIVFADWMGRSPQDIEEQVTYPLSVQLQGLAGVKTIRSSSEPNFSMINVIFDEKTDPYFARQRVLERLTTAKQNLPNDVTPVMAPDATALGQIFWYTVEGEGKSLDELRAIQDFTVKYQLTSIPGVAEVATVGGFVREYQVDVDPGKLRVYNLPLSAVQGAISASNLSVGGKVIVANNADYQLRGVGWLRGVTDLENTVVASRSGVPIRVKDVAAVQLGPEFRRGVLEKNGAEAVGGVVLMRYGQNPLAVTQAIKDKIRELQSGLPASVRIIPFYDRTRLIESAIHTVTGTLQEEMLIASIAILLILTHFRSAIVVCITLPLAVLISFLCMYYLDIPSNIMSLCGIAISIGILVDAAVVMVENATHELKLRFGDKPITGDTSDIVVQACRLVGRPIFFSVLIMLLSFLPIFLVTGQAGKLSHPLAYTKSFAMLGVALLGITLVPALIPLLIRGRLKSEEQNWIVRSFIHIYKPTLTWIIDRPAVVWWLLAVILLVATAYLGVPALFLLVLALAILVLMFSVRRDGWTAWVLSILVAMVAIAALSKEPLHFSLISTRHWSLVIPIAFATLFLLSLLLRHHRTAAVTSLLIIGLLASMHLRKLGTEFMPELNEGSIMDMPISAPRIALSQAIDDVKVRDRLIQSFPEVEMAVGKIGRAETATDPSPTEMVETVVTLRPTEHWPKRKITFHDALHHAADMATRLSLHGWLRSDAGKPINWNTVADAVADPEILKRNANLEAPAEILNIATQTAVDRLDRTLRDLARRRQIEFQSQVAGSVGNVALDDLLSHIRALPWREGRAALLREPSPQERSALLKTIEKNAELLATLPRQEEVDLLLSTIRGEMVRLQLASDRDDLLLDSSDFFRRGLVTLADTLGRPMATFSQRLLTHIESERDRLWRQRITTLDWELFDYAVPTLSDLLSDQLLRTAAGTPLEGIKPANGDLLALRDSFAPGLKNSLFLWHKTKNDLVDELNSELQMPGWGNVWTQPIQNRISMLATGVRTDIGVKVFGPTNKSLAGENGAIADVQRVSEQIQQKLATLAGAVNPLADQALGKRYIEIEIDREKAARYGVNVADINAVIETAIGGSRITTTVEGRQRFPVRLRYARDYWQDLDAIRNVLVPTNTTPARLIAGKPAASPSMPTANAPKVMMTSPGPSPSAESAKGNEASQVMPAAVLPLHMLASIRVVEGPAMIKSENGRLRNYVTLNVKDRDILGFVQEAKEAIKPIEAQLAGSGMSIEWTGEFENILKTWRTLWIVLPIVVLIIFFLLFVTFHDLQDTLLVFLAVIGALGGSVIFQALFGFKMSIIVTIGYIAALGMATETGVIMLVYLHDALAKRGGLQGISSLDELRQAVIDGAVHRLRPKLLTEGTAIIGLVPMLWASGAGAEIMRPMAAPVLGGLLLADEVIDLMIPVLFYAIRKRRWMKLHQVQSLRTPAISLRLGA